ncbi:MAG TPA: anti-sigma factor [Acidimicrobiales bacterium]|jgi:anti-sigma-K factor RskA|nr:anti-sigma factor [Acidimicrobiales bacterium]
MNHDDASELLAPLALDALDDDARVAIEAHVDTCAECQTELDGLREVASALGNTVESPPEGLWDKIAQRLYDTERDVATLPPLLTEYPVSEARRARRVVRRARAVVAATLVAAAAAILGLSINLSSENHQVANLQNAMSASVIRQALATPGHRLVALSGTTRQVLATFVLMKDGTGYLVSSKMPALPSGETYQLWGIVAGKAVSIGVMGSSPHNAAFTLASSPGPSKLAVTVEPAGGSQTPTTPLVASGVV